MAPESSIEETERVAIFVCGQYSFPERPVAPPAFANEFVAASADGSVFGADQVKTGCVEDVIVQGRLPVVIEQRLADDSEKGGILHQGGFEFVVEMADSGGVPKGAGEALVGDPSCVSTVQNPSFWRWWNG